MEGRGGEKGWRVEGGRTCWVACVGPVGRCVQSRRRGVACRRASPWGGRGRAGGPCRCPSSWVLGAHPSWVRGAHPGRGRGAHPSSWARVDHPSWVPLDHPSWGLWVRRGRGRAHRQSPGGRRGAHYPEGRRVGPSRGTPGRRGRWGSGRGGPSWEGGRGGLERKGGRRASAKEAGRGEGNMEVRR
jgi:hypothetical protein